MQRLGHRVHPECLLQPGREGGNGCKRMRELLLVEAQDLGCRRGGAKAAYGAGVVPVLVMRTAHCGADARRDFITDYHRPQELLA